MTPAAIVTKYVMPVASRSAVGLIVSMASRPLFEILTCHPQPEELVDTQEATARNQHGRHLGVTHGDTHSCPRRVRCGAGRHCTLRGEHDIPRASLDVLVEREHNVGRLGLIGRIPSRGVVDDLRARRIVDPELPCRAREPCVVVPTHIFHHPTRLP